MQILTTRQKCSSNVDDERNSSSISVVVVAVSSSSESERALALKRLTFRFDSSSSAVIAQLRAIDSPIGRLRSTMTMMRDNVVVIT